MGFGTGFAQGLSGGLNNVLGMLLQNKMSQKRYDDYFSRQEEADAKRDIATRGRMYMEAEAERLAQEQAMVDAEQARVQSGGVGYIDPRTGQYTAGHAGGAPEGSSEVYRSDIGMGGLQELMRRAAEGDRPEAAAYGSMGLPFDDAYDLASKGNTEYMGLFGFPDDGGGDGDGGSVDTSVREGRFIGGWPKMMEHLGYVLDPEDTDSQLIKTFSDYMSFAPQESVPMPDALGRALAANPDEAYPSLVNYAKDHEGKIKKDKRGFDPHFTVEEFLNDELDLVPLHVKVRHLQDIGVSVPEKYLTAAEREKASEANRLKKFLESLDPDGGS